MTFTSTAYLFFLPLVFFSLLAYTKERKSPKLSAACCKLCILRLVGFPLTVYYCLNDFGNFLCSNINRIIRE